MTHIITSLCLRESHLVTRIGKEGDLARGCIFERTDLCYDGGGIPGDSTAKAGHYVRK